MQYREFPPHPALKHHVDCFWTSRSFAGGAPHLVLPDGCIDFLFRVSGRGRVIGTMRQAILVPATENEIVAVRFRPMGAIAFLRAPAQLFTDRDADLDLFWGSGARRLEERLAEAPASRRIPILEAELLDRLSAAPALDPLARALRALSTSSSPAPTVDDLAVRTGLSRRQLERRFLQAVGVGPKMFLRVLRLQKTVRALSPAAVDWADLALQQGYFDQAHLIREFRDLSGESPARYWRERVSHLSNSIPAPADSLEA